MSFYLVLLILHLCNGFEENLGQSGCGNIEHQRDIFIDRVTGIWFAMEIILHNPEISHSKQRFYLDVCPIINIEEMGDYILTETVHGLTCNGTLIDNIDYNPTPSYFEPRHDRARNENRNYWRKPQYATDYDSEGRRIRRMKRLKLEWDENQQRTTYFLSYDNATLGYWRTANSKPRANEFVGGIHVLKAINDHMVLIFCQVTPQQELFSVILSRQYEGLLPSELSDIHLRLAQKGLSVKKIEKVCNYSSTIHHFNLENSMLFFIGYFLFQKYYL